MKSNDLAIAMDDVSPGHCSSYRDLARRLGICRIMLDFS